MKWMEKYLNEIGVEDAETALETFKKDYFPENAVPKDDYNKKADKVDELEGELNTAKTNLKETNDSLEELKTKAENADDYKTQLDEITNKYDEYKEQESARISKIKTKNALEKKLLTDNVPKDLVDLVVNDFDTEQLELTDEGKLLNYESQREKTKEKRPSAFAETTISGTKPSEGDKGKIVDNPFKAETRNLTKQSELVKEKPETAKKLIKAAGKNPARYGL